MANVIEITGKTVEEAIQAAVAQLGVEASNLDVEVLELPKKKLFGLFGETPAKIRATVKNSESPAAVEPAPIEEPPAPETPDVPDKEFEPILEPSPVAEAVTEAESFDRERAIDAAGQFLQDVFAAMGLEVTLKVTDSADDCRIELLGKNLGILIGRRGQALDALQYLLNLAVNRHAEDKVHFTLDAENYRQRREQTLIKLAKSVAERAIKTRKEVRLEAMNRHERKIIHTVLQDNDRVETHSTGEEPYRCVVVTPVKRGRK
ncbi:MAG: protein jag [Quinella sp. 1Q7]|nr:protein jag [Quinella sp. 1Q7]